MAVNTSPQTSAPIDPFKHLNFTRNPDGTVTRKIDTFSIMSSIPEPANSEPYLAKDITINPSTTTWARIFLPRRLPSDDQKVRLPVIIYIHGGGFVHCSPHTSMFHDFCSIMAVELTAVVVSVGYRLAPEHRLPAAYDNAMEALQWIKTSQDDWLNKFGDIKKCYIMGSSAGGNIAYQLGLRAAEANMEVQPLKIQGLILHQPFFGGMERTKSELRLVNDQILPSGVSDLMWELSLPVGVDRDHEYCNPTVDGGSKKVDVIKRLEWKVLVSGCDGDPLFDRQIEFVKMMKGKGADVVEHFGGGGYHGVEVLEPSKNKLLFRFLKDFVCMYVLHY